MCESYEILQYIAILHYIEARFNGIKLEMSSIKNSSKLMLTSFVTLKKINT